MAAIVANRSEMYGHYLEKLLQIPSQFDGSGIYYIYGLTHIYIFIYYGIRYPVPGAEHELLKAKRPARSTQQQESIYNFPHGISQ